VSVDGFFSAAGGTVASSFFLGGIWSAFSLVTGGSIFAPLLVSGTGPVLGGKTGPFSLTTAMSGVALPVLGLRIHFSAAVPAIRDADKTTT